MQMKMFLTRLGSNAKAVITGDITQIDLSDPGGSGLVAVREILEGIEGIRFITFGEEDVVRHRLVKRIIRAFSAMNQKTRKTAETQNQAGERVESESEEEPVGSERNDE
jgi:phosphate starvation-inducible PhoH-like protein